MKALVLAAGLVATPLAAQSVTQQTPRHTELTAQIGAVLWEKAVYAGERVLRLDADVAIAEGTPDEVEIRSGASLVIVRTKKLKACLEQQIVNLGGTDFFNWHGCLIDSDDDGRFDRGAPDDFSNGKPLPEPIAYVRPPADTRGGPPRPFHWTITYGGKAGKGWRFTYKVFAADPLKPAISEDVTVPVEGAFPQTVDIKDITVTLLGTGTGGLTYKIDKGSDDQN